MTTTMLRHSTWGLDTDRATPWQHRAACIDTAHLHTGDHRGVVGASGPTAQAIHICLRHCPVLRQCRHYTARLPDPLGIVQAGRLWPEVVARRTSEQPADLGCGAWCARHREREAS